MPVAAPTTEREMASPIPMHAQKYGGTAMRKPPTSNWAGKIVII